MRQVGNKVPDGFSYPESPHTVEKTTVLDAKALEGVVVDAAGFPLPQALVEHLSAEGKRVEAVFTDSKGRFAMNPRALSMYALKLSKPGFDSLLIRVKISKSKKKDLRLTLTVSR